MKNKKLIVITSVLVAIPVYALGSDGVPLLDTLAGYLESPLAQTMAGLGLVEMLLRLTKSTKPLSVMYGVAKVAHQAANLLSKLAQLLDKALPQRLK